MLTGVAPAMTMASEKISFLGGKGDNYVRTVLFPTRTHPSQGAFSGDPKYVTAACGVGKKCHITQ